MGAISKGGGIPDNLYLQKMYWAVIGTAIGLAVAVNVFNKAIAYQRIVYCNATTPAKPETLSATAYATLTAIAREIANASQSSSFLRHCNCSSPTLGQLLLVLTNMAVILVLCFYKLDTIDHWHWEDVAYRTGFIAAAQLPLVILLAGKRNIIGFLVGLGYERLIWLHRWVSRTLFLTATIHMGFWFRSWARYNYIGRKLATDAIAQRGLAAWCVLLWIFLSSFAPIRRLNYEFFIIQHIVTFVGFLVAVFLHLPDEVKAYIWIPIGLYILDRVVRTVFVLWANLSLFHPRLRRDGAFTCETELMPAGGGMSRFIIKNPPITWQPGQHVFLQCHGIAPLQSHPFTVASIPEDGKMEFLVRSRSGATKRFLTRTLKSQTLPASQRDLNHRPIFKTIIDGPYGRMRVLRQFDSVILIAGGCGATFTTPLLRDIVDAWKRPRTRTSIYRLLGTPTGVATRHVRFIWVIKTKVEYQWFSAQLAQTVNDVEKIREEDLDLRVDITVYVTCDTSLEPETIWENKRSREVLDDTPQELSVLEKPPIRDEYSGATDASNKHMPARKTWGLGGSCCFATVIEDEREAQRTKRSLQPCCCCTQSTSVSSCTGEELKHATSSNASGGSVSDIRKPFIATEGSLDAQTSLSNCRITSMIGRPHCKVVIRKVLEQARGESAVVVCGPQGLNNDVRNSVVAMSDERAVHKGTGAQGIYFWEEGFSY